MCAGRPKIFTAHRGPGAIYQARAGIHSVTIVAFIISPAPIRANATEGLVSAEESLIHIFLMLKATPAKILFWLRLPNALPNLRPRIPISAGIRVPGGITRE
jgi:ABC-type nitrate/sulfonate/bicarbonate transport system permease component